MLTKRILAPVVALLIALGICAGVRAQEADQLAPEFLAKAHPMFHSDAAVIKAMSSASLASAGTSNLAVTKNFGIPNIDSLVNFNGHYTAPGLDPFGNPNSYWLYNMVGNPPQTEGRTVISAPVIPVSLDLRNADGSPRYVNGQRLYSDATKYVKPVLHSPIFRNLHYSSSEQPTQYNDAVQRASFGDEAEDSWHTLLKPDVKTPRVMTLLAGSYYFALNSDGSCCFYVLVDENTFSNELFPPTYPVDGSTVIGAAELAGDMTTKDISTLLFPNAFLYGGSPQNCCVLGFHSYDYEPGIPANGNLERRYVMDYSSWISPGIFGGGFEDITALSHELAETFADPFVASDGVHNVTPWWLSGSVCSEILEVGDVIESLPNPTYAVAVDGFTYHPQVEALLPWFEFKPGRRYSFPDPTVLPSLSPFENVNCAP